MEPESLQTNSVEVVEPADGAIAEDGATPETPQPHSLSSKIAQYKTWIIIGGAALLALLLIGGLSLLMSGGDTIDDDHTTIVDGEGPPPPVADIESLISTFPALSSRIIHNDVLEFRGREVNAGERVLVWIFSPNPQFLGSFFVRQSGDVIQIAGLSAAFTQVGVEPGQHNLAIVTSEDRIVGRLGIEVQDDGSVIGESDGEGESGSIAVEFRDVTIDEIIRLETRYVRDPNMLTGVQWLVQFGQEGTSRITYRVAYNAYGRELSRTRINETVIRPAIDRVIHIGISDHNLNDHLVFAWLTVDLWVATNCQAADGSFYTCADTSRPPIDTRSLTRISHFPQSPLCYLQNDMIRYAQSRNLAIQENLGGCSDNIGGTWNNFTGRDTARIGELRLTPQVCSRWSLTCGSW